VTVQAVGANAACSSSSLSPSEAAARTSAERADGGRPPEEPMFRVVVAARNGLVRALTGGQLRPWIGSRFYA
jgi:hypothetical protein